MGNDVVVLKEAHGHAKRYAEFLENYLVLSR